MKSRKGSLLYQYIFKYILVFASGNRLIIFGYGIYGLESSIVKSMVHSNVVEQCIRSDLVERRPELGTSRITCRIW
ncbi:hypothetical protein T4E_3533 [Trichinella pseudospiralis]|uniref:Uncharacterized protein n=1 Tax=Trichinella pseudospiralis TaxID=6337 RepID=A0A0V0XFP9_TRIPS|nr:hypothetical protein T4E_3533 [Trichinella pseudospiralis]